MKVLMIGSRETVEVSAGYGNRLVGQGKAVPVKAEARKEEQEAEEKPKKKPGKKADKDAEGQDRG